MYGDALDILRGSRERLMQGWGNVKALHYKEADNSASAVTALDVEIEETVSKALKGAFPEIEFVGEEKGGKRVGRFWLMDPIDGTAHYIRGTPLCTSMLALIEDERVVFGAIYDFVSNRMYHAELGGGSYCNDEKITVSDRNLRAAYVGLETHYDDSNDMAYFDKLQKRTMLVHTITAGWELAMVASGRFDGRICLHPFGKDYDFAPGTLLVKEAGGVVANIGTTNYDYRNLDFIATNQVIFKELTEGPEAIFPIT